ncbi:MAG: hypothetical protein MJY48_04910 [Bacteroidales bacterium]|nr:hypothetical protein [Bacteroidales bacterium]
MKALFITYNQAYNEEIVEILAKFGQRGYTRWQDVQGKGTFNGFPRMGSHAWPELNQAVFAAVKDEKIDAILAELKRCDEQSPELGLKAFVWNIETIY